jgi:uncharacterized cupredoxin-like copper-binding protein
MKKKLAIFAIVAALMVSGGLTALSASAATNSTSKGTPIKVKDATQSVTSKDTGDNQSTGAKSVISKGSTNVDHDLTNEKGEVETGEGTEVEDKNETNDNESADETEAETQEDKNEPGGDHQDPEGVNVDHQFEGSE